jgi:uncharacterized membrane protein
MLLRWVVLLVAISSTAVASLGYAHGSFDSLGVLPGTNICRPSAISADASTVVGYCTVELYQPNVPFRWTRSTGILPLELSALATSPFDNYRYGSALDVSADGSAIVGMAGQRQYEWIAVRWTEAGGVERLGELEGGGTHWAMHISGDGSIVAGDRAWDDSFQAFRWTALEGMTNLCAEPPRDECWSQDLSGDGTTIVGMRDETDSRAFRWTVGEGFTDLIYPSDWYLNVTSVSHDGSVIAGDVVGDDGETEAYLLTRDEILLLGRLTGDRASWVNDVSDDGWTVLGDSSLRGLRRPFLWDPIEGLRELRGVAIGAGIDLSGWTLTSAIGISGDGRTITGYGTSPLGAEEAWVLALPELDSSSSGAATVAALLLLAAFRSLPN